MQPTASPTSARPIANIGPMLANLNIYSAKKETLHRVFMFIMSLWNNIVYVCKCYMKLRSNSCELVTALVPGFFKIEVNFEVKRHGGRFEKSQKCEEIVK